MKGFLENGSLDCILHITPRENGSFKKNYSMEGSLWNQKLLFYIPKHKGSFFVAL